MYLIYSYCCPKLTGVQSSLTGGSKPAKTGVVMDVYAKLFTQLIIPEYESQFLLQIMLIVHKIVFINPLTY